MSNKFNINKILFTNGQEISPRKINIIVGPNNCGKTTLLKDIYNCLINNTDISKILIKGINFLLPSSWKQMKETYFYEIVNVGGGYYTLKTNPTDYISNVENQIFKSEKEVETEYNNFKEKQTEENRISLFDDIGNTLISFFRTSNRLLFLNEDSYQSLQNYSHGPKSPMEALVSNKCAGKDEIVESAFESIFREKIKLLNIPNSHSKFKLQIDNSEVDHNVIKSIFAFDEKNPDIIDQGDGFNAGLNMLVFMAISFDHPVVLIDEPETFLHPSQIQRFGGYLPSLVNDNQQIFIATHSADFIKGLISYDKNVLDSINIIHITRDEKTTQINEINDINSNKKKDRNKKLLTNIYKAPFILGSNVLDGLFHEYSILCEGDNDVSFYKKAFEKNGNIDDINFVACESYSPFKEISNLYKRSNVKFAIIGDVDNIIHGDNKDALKKAKSDFLSLVHILNDGRESKTINDNLDKLYSCYKNKPKEDLDKDYEALQEEGINAFEDERREYLNNIVDECKKNGLFLVPCGVLESWYKQLDQSKFNNGNKRKKAGIALETLDEEQNLEKYSNLKEFVGSIKDYLES